MTALCWILQAPTAAEYSSEIKVHDTDFTMNQAISPFKKGTDPFTFETDLTWGGALFFGGFRQVEIPGNQQFSIEKGKILVDLQSVHFESNIAIKGGAIAFVKGSLMSMEQVNFSCNAATDGGALFLYLDGDLDPQLAAQPTNYVNGANLTFHKNEGTRGGALHLSVSVASAGLDKASISPKRISRFTQDRENNNEDDVFFESSYFTDNEALISGGAWHVERGRVGCLNCTFTKNAIVNSAEGFGGAVTLLDQGALHGRYVKFIENFATVGGAIYAHKSLLDIINGRIIANNATENGGGVYIYIPSGTPFKFGVVGLIEHTIFHANIANIGGELRFPK